MSDSDADIYAWANEDAASRDSDDRGGAISGGAPPRSRRKSGGAPKYKDSSSSSDDGGSDDEVVVVDSDEDEEDEFLSAKPAKKPPPKKKAPPKKKSPPKPKAAAKMEEAIDVDDGDKKPAAASSSAKANASAGPAAENEGIDVVIPHALLNKDKGTGKNECTMLVQVGDNDDTSHHLDFHGQSGAIGRFEADEEGVILDLKGYQYRGTIRPGPTAMVVALNRDGRFKVEAITDEFVTLDADTKTDVMAKLDAVVRGDMDDSYKYREENVNARKRGKKGEEAEEGDGGGGKKGKKRAAGTAAKGGNAAKKRKTAVAKK
ncbi:hypothetical protein ACHAXT_005011 [Thalassiosira profunda]